MKWYIMVLRKYTVFTGRSRRKEFWMFVLFNIIFTVVFRIIDRVTGLNFSDSSPYNGGWISILYSLVVLIPSLAVTVRRFHDIGKSGWVYFRFFLAMIVVCCTYVGYMVYSVLKGSDLESLKEGAIDPAVFTGSFFLYTFLFVASILIVAIWLLVLLLRDSQWGDNKWGPNPKAAEIPVMGQ